MINLNEMKKDYIGREPRDYIVESVTVPEGLEEKVLAAMTQKRKEIEEIQKEKQEKKAAHKSVALRAAVIAAVITLMILIIPSSRQVVVSAAESAWNAFHSWVDDVFHVGMKKSDNGFTLEIVNARLSNDFLYLDVSEYCDNKTKEKYKRYSSHGYIEYSYYGSIYNQSNGKSINFSCDEYYGVASGEIDQKLADQYASSNKELLFYDFYVPDVKKIIDSYNDHIKCQLKVKVKLFVNSNDGETIDKGEIASINTEFMIKNFDSVLQSEVRSTNSVLSYDSFDLIFEKLVIAPSELYMIVKIEANNNTSVNVNDYSFNMVVNGIKDNKIVYNKIQSSEGLFDKLPFRMWNHHRGTIRTKDACYIILELFDIEGEIFGSCDEGNYYRSINNLFIPNEYMISRLSYAKIDNDDSEIIVEDSSTSEITPQIVFK